ncbi:unnamed protein product [Cylindrotheca closterium]|uniref:guanylate cyclase n=1 Tax=Cylindrotheca closterium TaxID=2856 RepID=A0AAD2FKZ9_9STRA|nr:unnamed protein product [Cylindrotheca closterium]
MTKLQRVLFLLVSHILFVSSQNENILGELWPEGELNCVRGFRQYNPITQKKLYHVGVHASAGIETAKREFNLTFEEYLNEAVGKRWDPPIEFKMKITDDSMRDWLDNKEDVDFMYTDTGIYSCIGVEIGAKPIATTVARLESRGRNYELDIFAGTMMVLADNDDIGSIEDLKGKVIGAQAFSDFAGAQAQFYMMQKEGINPLIDAKQVIFTGNNEDTIQGILDGRWDVGFVRTGQVERTMDPSTGQLVDPTLVKVIAPRIHIMDGGELFPFLHSTPVFPEWPFAAKDTVDHIVAEEVGDALMALNKHATIGQLIVECQEAATTQAEKNICDTSPPEYFDPNARCDTSRELATLAYNAGLAGFHDGFHSPRSHFHVRTMQQDGGFIIQDAKGNSRCERNSKYYNGITCPDGYYKVSEDIFDAQCQAKGLSCQDGYSCYCQPCIQAFDVSVFPWNSEDGSSEFSQDSGCYKMSLCGVVQQRGTGVFRAFDNLRRTNATMVVKSHVGGLEKDILTREVEPFLYEFEFSQPNRGISILEIFVNGEQIPESPIQVQVVDRDCDAAYPGENRIPDAQGECVCPSGTIEIDEICASTNAHEVSVYPWEVDGEYQLMNITIQSGCEKMSLCGAIPQTKEIRFKAQDNRKRDNATVTALMHIGQEEWFLSVVETDPFVYEFGFSHNERGVAILEIFVDEVQIPDSPIRVEITNRDCNNDFPGQRMVPSTIGVCECSDSTIKIGEECVPLGTFTAIMAAIGGLIGFLIVYCYLGYRRRKSDEVWHVNPEELDFSHPVEVIGQGAFGVVLAAEYRGTRVAIKSVIPRQDTVRSRAGSMPSVAGSVVSGSNVSQDDSKDGPSDVEAGADSPATHPTSDSRESALSDSNLSDLLELPIVSKKSRFSKWMPFHDAITRSKLHILGHASGASTTPKSLRSKLLYRCDETYQRQQEFKAEMRLLSRLRHPCITTVMGAVMAGDSPMMVMECMENGSLYDLLRNETLYTGGEIIMQIVRDVAQGLRFLHASKPPILHRDLKAKNILIDSRFRAKVADFGLSTKNKKSLSGTPFWMAPEYILGKTEYTPSCDIYAFGMIIYEIYSRKIPYEGQNPRKVLRKVCDPRINYRPQVPDTCPKRMTEIMKKCWSNNSRVRPDSKDLDMIFADMGSHEAEPLIDQENTRLRTEVAAGDMLYQVFPKKVADQLKLGQKVEPETHNNVTVFFSDIVRFTDISRTLSAVKVCEMLDRLYLAFDALANKHEVFKVETIGDAWVGVTNLEENQNSTHAKRIAEFAIDAVAAANNVLIDVDDPSAGCIHIRVGFHSGPVVSNVIGSLNPRYALFGDTMNTASRMESLSTSDRIQCSEASARILKEQAPDFPMRRRGKVAVKGKGHMVAYWVGSEPTRERSLSRSKRFDEKPLVEFKADEEERGKRRIFRKRNPKRVNMAGAMEEDPSNSAPNSILRKSIMKGRDKNRRPSFSSQ